MYMRSLKFSGYVINSAQRKKCTKANLQISTVENNCFGASNNDLGAITACLKGKPKK